MLLVARGRRWILGCGSFVRECRFYCLFPISPRYDVGETSSKLTCHVPVVTGTILRQLTRWHALRGLLPRPREHFSVGILSSDGPWRGVSIAPEPDRSASPGDEHSERRHTDCSTPASLCLQQLLGIDAKEAELCIKKHRGLTAIDPADITRNHGACLNAGFSKACIKGNPGILSFPQKVLETKIQFIANMNIAVIDDAIPFFQLSVPTLCTFSKKLTYESMWNNGVHTIAYMAKELQCPTLTVCQIMTKHPFMRRITLAKLSQVLKIMLDSHINSEDILSDVWSLRYNPDMIIDRLKRVTEAGVYPVKPWMIRCPEFALTRRIGKEMHRRSVLGDKGTVVEYLVQRFGCDKETIDALSSKYPKILHVSGPKMKRVIDFLFENGYTVEDMMRVPRVLFHKLETMQARIIELQKYGHKPKSLIVFCKSKLQYNVYLEMIIRKSFIANSK